jgi:hypothetical protein
MKLASDRVQWQVFVYTLIYGLIQNKEFLGWQTNLQIYIGWRRNKWVEMKAPSGNEILTDMNKIKFSLQYFVFEKVNTKVQAVSFIYITLPWSDPHDV